MPETTPRVSVIIPAYNHEGYVGEAIASVLGQSLAELECVVIDDGSSDGTLEVARSISDPRLRVYTQPNQGTHATLNRGLELACAPVLAVLNSDDRFHPERLARCLEFLAAEPSRGLVFTGVRLIDGQGRPLHAGPEHDWLSAAREFYAASGDLPLSLLKDNFACTTSNIVFTRELVGRIGPFAPLRYVNDLDFLLRAAGAGALDVLPAELVDYRVHVGNTIAEKRSLRSDFLYETAWVAARTLCLPGLARTMDPPRLSQVLGEAYNYDAAAILELLHWMLAHDCRPEALLEDAELRGRAMEVVERDLERRAWVEELQEGLAWNTAERRRLAESREWYRQELEGAASRNRELAGELAASRRTSEELWEARNFLMGQVEAIRNSRSYRLLTLKGELRSPRDVPKVSKEFLRIVLPPRVKDALKRLLGRPVHPTAPAVPTESLARRARRKLTRPVPRSQTRHEGPLVSVITPCFNGGPYVDQLLACLDAQTFRNFEHIFIDDGSTDPATMARVDALEDAGRPNTLVLRQDNAGVIAARNAAIAKARGRYIFPLDVDDTIEPTFLEKCLLTLERSGPDRFVYTWTLSHGARTFVWQTRDSDPDELLAENRCGFAVYPCEAFAAAEGYDPAMADGYEDWELCVDMVRRGWVGIAIPEPLYRYEVKAGSRNDQAIARHRELVRRMTAMHGEALAARRAEARKALAACYTVADWQVNLIPEGGPAQGAFRFLDLCGEELPAPAAMVLADLLAWLRAHPDQILMVALDPRWRPFFDHNPHPRLRPYFPALYDPCQPDGRWFAEYVAARYAAVPLGLDELGREVEKAGKAGDTRIGVLFVAPWLITGGADRMAVDWFRHLPGEDFAKFLVLTEPSHNEWLPQVAGFADEILDLPALGVSGEAEIGRFLADYAARRKVDVVHVMHSAKGYAALPRIKAARPGVVNVAQMHCFDYLPGGRRAGYPQDVPSKLDAFIDHYNVVSDALAAEMRLVHPRLDVSPEKFKVIRCSVTVADFDPDRIPNGEAAAARRPGALNILFVGRLDPQKNPLRMARVARELAARGVDFAIHVLGSGSLDSQEPELRRYLADHGLTDRVLLHGFQPPEAMPDWYAAGDVLLMTSDWEGIPVVVYEAMAAGVVVVAPKVGGMAELLLPGLGVLIQDRDDVTAYAKALQELADDPAAAREMGLRAREHVAAHYDVAVYGAEYAAWYRELCGRSGT